MFTLDGDVLQEALRENEADNDWSDRQQGVEAEDACLQGADAIISESLEPFDGRGRKVGDPAMSIRVSPFNPLFGV